MTVLALVRAIRKGGGEIALSGDGRSLIGRNIPKPLHAAVRVTGNREKVLHYLRVFECHRDGTGSQEWAMLAEAAGAAELETRRYVTSPWTGGLITTDEYLETYTTGDRPPS